MPNPFKPSTGASPPELIGRDANLDRVREALADGPGSPGRISLFTGSRGIGKTVMLNEVEDLYLAAGWLRVSVTATGSLLRQIGHRVIALGDEVEPGPRRRVTGLSFPGGAGIGWENVPVTSTDLRQAVDSLLDVLGPDRGLLITIDEVHGGARADMREVSALAQHLVREDRQFALAMAGLPTAVSNLLSDHVLTFLRRADRHTLRSLHVDDVDDAFRHTIEQNGRRIAPGASATAAAATHGYPFLVQLVGYHLWRVADANEIDADAVSRGVEAARSRLTELVHQTALNDLSDVDRDYLVAMSVDDGPSRTADIARRLGQTPQYANTYRARLLAAGMIESPARGRVDLAIPYLRDTLREMGGELS